MAKIFNRWIQELNRYFKLQKQFTHDIHTMVMIKTMLLSIGISIAYIAIPVLIGVNLMIFIELRFYLLIYFLILGIIFIELYYHQFKKWVAVFDPSIKRLNLSFLFHVERRIIQILFIFIFLIIISQLGVSYV